MTVRIYDAVPLEFYAGGEATIVELANFLGAHGYDVEVVVDSRYRGPTRLSTSQVGELVHYFRYVREEFATHSFPFFAPFFRRFPSARAMEPDDLHLIIIDRPPPVSFLEDVRAKGLAKVGLLMHGFSFESMVDTNPSIAGLQLFVTNYLRLFSSSFRRAGVIIQVFTSDTANRLAGLGIPRDRVHVIPSGVPVEKFPSPAVRDSFQVVYVGRIDARMKGSDLLLQIASAIERRRDSRVSLSIVGSGPDARSFERFIGGGRVIYHKFVPEQEKMLLLQKSDLMVSTSYMDPYPLSVIEGLVSGLPVVSTNASGPRAIVKMNPAYGSVLGRSAKSFVDTFSDYYRAWREDRDGFLRRKQYVRESAISTFDQKRMLSRYLALVEGIGQ